MPPSDTSEPPERRSSNRRIGFIAAAGALAMVGAAYAAVPIYKRFCELTGFDGTPGRAKAAPTADKALDRKVTVRFDTNVRGGLPWTFETLQRSQEARIGAPQIAYFRVRNDSDEAITGRATFNVTPESAGAYFIKTQCFCFDDQTIAAGQEVRFPVLYFLEPEFATSTETRNYEEVTLSYTFFRSQTQAAAPPSKAPAKS